MKSAFTGSAWRLGEGTTGNDGSECIWKVLPHRLKEINVSTNDTEQILLVVQTNRAMKTVRIELLLEYKVLTLDPCIWCPSQVPPSTAARPFVGAAGSCVGMLSISKHNTH